MMMTQVKSRWQSWVNLILGIILAGSEIFWTISRPNRLLRSGLRHRRMPAAARLLCALDGLGCFTVKIQCDEFLTRNRNANRCSGWAERAAGRARRSRHHWPVWAWRSALALLESKHTLEPFGVRRRRARLPKGFERATPHIAVGAVTAECRTGILQEQ